MRNAKGFTLIELLIVIAIIGILAAVLIPNLLSARNLAQDRAAQAYGSQVYTAGNAYLAEDVDHAVADIIGGCNGGVTFSSFSVDDPGTAVKSCTLAAGAGSEFTVAVVSINDTPFSF